jgi:carbamoyl-phosphate synthase small subunit
MLPCADRKLITEDGDEYFGYAFGATEDKITELVFNTSPVGYQEIVSDPSYTDQTVVMAYPLIGNYGIAEDDFETRTSTIGALAVRDYNDTPSNFRSVKTLGELMREYNISGISGIDTRRLVRSIRDLGSRKVLMTGADTPLDEGLALINAYSLPHDAVARVSTAEVRRYKTDSPRYHVVAVDCGIKSNIIRSLNRRACDVTVVPWNVSPSEVEAFSPDGVVISNGPGDPTDVIPVIELVKAIRGRYPMFGICLGHQIISLAYGAKTYKLKFGHRGGNHPVRNLATGRIEITSQNHSYAADADSFKNTPFKVTHLNLLDKTVEGAECEADMVFSVQYHPESAPGPQDSAYLFDRFVNLMEAKKLAEKN